MKMAKCIMELERIYGIGHGGNRNSSEHNVNLPKPTQKDLAENMGITQQQLNRYKQLDKLIPELQDLVEEGEMKATVGYKVWAKMSGEEQGKLNKDYCNLIDGN